MSARRCGSRSCRADGRPGPAGPAGNTGRRSREWPDGDHWADQAKEQDQHGNDLLHDLGELDGTEERFDELVEDLTNGLRAHVAFEDAVFMKLEAVTSEEERADLGRKIRKAKKHAPTRPHPHAPDEGVTARLAAKGAAPIDKARDAVGKRPAKGKRQQSGE